MLKLHSSRRFSKNTLGEYVSDKGMTQLRIAETEKYAHVTFFFNGGVEKQYPGEDRILVKSPAVATYDLQPEMSAYEVTDKLVPAIKSGKYDMIILNYANCDMVGHTGVFEAAVKAVETVDTCVGKVVDAIKEMGGVVLSQPTTAMQIRWLQRTVHRLLLTQQTLFLSA